MNTVYRQSLPGTSLDYFDAREAVEAIQARRIAVWSRYGERLAHLAQRNDVSLPVIPDYATNNAHMFYLVCDALDTRTRLIEHLKVRGVMAVFHYQALHASPFFAANNAARPLPQAARYTDCLVRLPLYADMNMDDVDRVADAVCDFFL